mgnify:CR=1 FL=1
MSDEANPKILEPDLWSAHFSAILAHSFDAIVSKDLSGNIHSWNPAAERVFGWSAAEVIGRPIDIIIPEDRAREEASIRERIRAGEVVSKFETVRVHKRGSLVPVQITVSPVINAAGVVVGASKIAHDITYLVEARNRLSESDDQFRLLANSIPQLAWMADNEGSIFWYNDRWFEYTGSTIEDMQGWGWTRVHHPDHVERVKIRIQRSWDTGEEWEDTFPLRGRDGEYRWFLSRAMPLRGRDGRVSRWFGTNTDITDQRRNQQQIEMLMEEVNHRAKNMISVIQALVSRTAGRDFGESLAARLRAVGRNQDLLVSRNWGGASLGDLIESQLASVSDLVGSRVRVSGQLDFTLSPSAAETIGLAIHELATNATKYGALSNENGEVRITCSVQGDREQGRLLIEWMESGGPPVIAPLRTGFGTVMIGRSPKMSLNAEVELGFPREGFFWRFAAPLASVRALG